MSPMDRRSFIKSAAAGAGLLAVGSKAVANAGPVNLALPNPGLITQDSNGPIKNVVVVMMENRSVDHYLGWYKAENPAFDATQSRTYVDANGRHVSTEDWGAAGRGDFAGCVDDPGHGHDNGLAQVRNTDEGGQPGEPDGFLKEGAGNDEFAVSYYQASDIPVTAALTRTFTTFDRYFCSWLGSTYPNREYMHSAQSHGITDNSFPPELASQNPNWLTGFDWPTIWTFLDRKAVTWKYYYSNLPVIALWGKAHLKGARPIAEYYADCAAGTLPQVAFIDPFFVAPEGLANDDHPFADIRLGQMFISDVTRSFMESSHWNQGAMFITYDEWGGFWDHVTPPIVDDPLANAPGDFGMLGFRVPTQLISPYAAGTRVDHTQYDHTSILQFIVSNWDLAPMSSWDHGYTRSTSNNIASAFQTSPDIDARDEILGEPAYIAPPTAFIPCVGRPDQASDLFGLVDSGWMEAMGYRTDFSFADSYRSPLPVRL